MDILLEILLCSAWAAFFIFLISRLSFFRLEGISKRWLQGVFILKILFGVGLWAIYTFYYTDRSTADIYKYFDDSKPMFDALKTQQVDYFKMLFGYQNDSEYFNQYYHQMNNWFREYDSNLYNDSHTLIRFNAAVRLVSLGYFNVHTVFMCFLSLLGLTALYKTFSGLLKDRKEWLFAAIFLLPSVMFWGSGVLKEGILFLGMGFLVYFHTKLLRKEGNVLLGLFWIVVSSLVLMYTKFYVLAAIIPGLIANTWLGLSGEKRPVLKYVLTYSFLMVLALGVPKLLPLPNPLELLTAKQRDFNLLVKGGVYLERIERQTRDTLYIEAQFYDQISYDHVSHKAQINKVPECWLVKDSLIVQKQAMVYGDSVDFHIIRDYGKTGSSIKTTPLEPNVWSFIKATPRAFYNAFFRPWPFESWAPFTLVAGWENILVLLFLVYALIKGNWQSVNWKWLLFCFGFIMIIYLLTGFTTPVLGSIVRYRAPALPLVLVIALLLHPPLKKDILSRWLGRRN